jgi:hypothetical protein
VERIQGLHDRSRWRKGLHDLYRPQKRREVSKRGILSTYLFETLSWEGKNFGPGPLMQIFWVLPSYIQGFWLRILRISPLSSFRVVCTSFWLTWLFLALRFACSLRWGVILGGRTRSQIRGPHPTRPRSELAGPSSEIVLPSDSPSSCFSPPRTSSTSVCAAF